MNTATEYGHYKSGVANSYSSREFANELKEILPKSPKAFTYMLKLAFQNTFPFTEDEIHSVIDDIAVSIPTTKLQELLGDTDAAETVNITKPPLIATELHSYLDVYGIGIAMLLARHKYGDLSETDRNQAAESESVISKQTGIFITEYSMQGYVVKISTDLSLGAPIIELI